MSSFISSPASSEPDLSGILSPGVAVDLALSSFPLRRGTGDRTVRLVPESGLWMAFHQRIGSGELAPVTVRVAEPASRFRPGRLRYQIFTLGNMQAATEVQRRLPYFLGLDEAALSSASEFDELLSTTAHLLPEKVLQTKHQFPGLRLMATGQLSEQFYRVIAEQKVPHAVARTIWRTLVINHGEIAPGPLGDQLRLPPRPEVLVELADWQWRKALFQPFQVRTMIQVAKRAATLDRLSSTHSLESLVDLVQTIPGIGPWSAAETLQRTHGAADLVSVGDYNLPKLVGEALSGTRTDDAGMLELLEPWAGHRQRIIRLIQASGIQFQRRGPKLSVRDMIELYLDEL